MQQDIIHVVIPVYNGGATIGETIQSVIAQRYPHWRLTVHDNCSKDNTREIVESFDDERITLIKHDEFLPMAENWNRSMEHIEGDFFQLLSADDKLHADCFSEKMKHTALPQHGDIAIFSSNRMLINKHGKPMFEIGLSRTQGVYNTAQIMKKMYKVINPIGDPATALVRASAVQPPPLSGRYPFFLVDMELWLHALAHGGVLHIPQALSYYRISANASSTTRFAKNYAETLRFYRDCIKPFYAKNLIRYYLGYGFITWRALARELLYRIKG